jgi:hypothetical protein
MMLMVNLRRQKYRRHLYSHSHHSWSRERNNNSGSEVDLQNETDYEHDSVDMGSTAFPDSTVWSSLFTLEGLRNSLEVNARLHDIDELHLQSSHSNNLEEEEEEAQEQSRQQSQQLRRRMHVKESENNDRRTSQSNNNNMDFRRRLSWFSAPKQVDPRKQVSLASMYNGNGTIGNNAIWDSAVRYLMQKNVLDSVLLVQQYAPLERKQCLYSESVLQKHTDKSRGYLSGIFSDMLQSMRLSYQSFYDKECGVNACPVILHE